jgi:dienelactone hydrolase
MSDNSASKKYLAKPSDLCCLSGTLHEGEERGKIQTISGLETYVATPKDGTGSGNVVLYFPDVFGLFKNARLILDVFADAGYLALGVDYFRGVSDHCCAHNCYPFQHLVLRTKMTLKDPITKHRDQDNKPLPGFDFGAWKDKHMSFALDAVPGWVDAVKEQYGKANTKYACVGYCFGAPFVCNELAGTTVSAGAFAHPAFLEEHHFSNLKSKSDDSPMLTITSNVDSQAHFSCRAPRQIRHSAKNPAIVPRRS